MLLPPHLTDEKTGQRKSYTQGNTVSERGFPHRHLGASSQCPPKAPWGRTQGHPASARQSLLGASLLASPGPGPGAPRAGLHSMCVVVGKGWTQMPGPEQTNPISGNKIQSAHPVQSEFGNISHTESTFTQAPLPPATFPKMEENVPFLCHGKECGMKTPWAGGFVCCSLLLPRHGEPCLPGSSCVIDMKMTLSPGQGAQLVRALSNTPGLWVPSPVWARTGSTNEWHQ